MNAILVVLLASVVSLLTTVAVLVVERRFDPFGAHAPQTRQVPDVVKLSEADARTNLQAHDLKVVLAAREVSADVAAGHVLTQSPAAGQRVLTGEIVTLKVAAPLPDVPALAGRSVEEARALLEAAGYSTQLGESVPSETVAPGLIVRQSPEAGAPSQQGRTVQVFPSSGKQVVATPKVAGLQLNAAKQAIEQAGLVVGPVQWVDRAETPSYVVLRQTPEPGSEVKTGAEVTLVVNAGD